jgi:hypothetical protein
VEGNDEHPHPPPPPVAPNQPLYKQPTVARHLRPPVLATFHCPFTGRTTATMLAAHQGPEAALLAHLQSVLEEVYGPPHAGTVSPVHRSERRSGPQHRHQYMAAHSAVVDHTIARCRYDANPAPRSAALRNEIYLYSFRATEPTLQDGYESPYDDHGHYTGGDRTNFPFPHGPWPGK